MREAMEGAMTLRVPLKVNIKVGPDWEHLSELPKGTPGASQTLATPHGPQVSSPSSLTLLI